MRNTSTVQQAKGDVFNARLGADLRAARERAGLSQAAVAEVFGWQRDAISKIECGKNSLTVLEYLTLVDFLRAFYPPDAPAVALADVLLPRGMGIASAMPEGRGAGAAGETEPSPQEAA